MATVREALELVDDDRATNLVPFPKFPCQKAGPTELLEEIARVARGAVEYAGDETMMQITGTLLARLVAELVGVSK